MCRNSCSKSPLTEQQSTLALHYGTVKITINIIEIILEILLTIYLYVKKYHQLVT